MRQETVREIDLRSKGAHFDERVKLDRFQLGAGIEVWICDYANARGHRVGAVTNALEIGVQVQGDIWVGGSRCEGRRFARGDVHTLSPGEAYSLAYDGTGLLVGFTVGPSFVAGDVDDAHRVRFVAPGGFRSSRLLEIAEHVVEGRRVGALDPAVTGELVAALSDGFELEPLDPVAMARIELERYATHDLYLEHIADAVGMNKTVLLRRFRARYGTTPIQYRIRTRMNLAVQRLWAEPERPIAGIAAECGFDHPGQFFRAFRSYVGATPDRYRRHIARSRPATPRTPGPAEEP